MGDLFNGPVTWFDFAILGVVVISAVMSLGRGLIREATSVASFFIGGAAALLTLGLFKKPLEDVMPDGWGTITPSIILVVGGFIVAYSLAAWLGGRLSKLIHSSPEIGVLDRLAGGAFGVVRGLAAGVLFILFVEQILPKDTMPEDIVRARSYSYLSAAAQGIRSIIPGFLPQAVDKSGNGQAPAGNGRPPAPARGSSPT